MGQAASGREPVRVEVLRRLAEQAMDDADFRADARDDLTGALRRHGYDLNDDELALVLRFRASLAQSGLDLDLVGAVDPAMVEAWLGSLGRREG